jgi:hypothetical protein
MDCRSDASYLKLAETTLAGLVTYTSKPLPGWKLRRCRFARRSDHALFFGRPGLRPLCPAAGRDRAAFLAAHRLLSAAISRSRPSGVRRRFRFDFTPAIGLASGTALGAAAPPPNSRSAVNAASIASRWCSSFATISPKPGLPSVNLGPATGVVEPDLRVLDQPAYRLGCAPRI